MQFFPDIDFLFCIRGLICTREQHHLLLSCFPYIDNFFKMGKSYLIEEMPATHWLALSPTQWQWTCVISLLSVHCESKHALDEGLLLAFPPQKRRQAKYITQINLLYKAPQKTLWIYGLNLNECCVTHSAYRLLLYALFWYEKNRQLFPPIYTYGKSD